MQILAENRKAKFDYQIQETLEAGLVLQGQEVKSVKQGHMSLAGSYVQARNGELFLLGATISPYQPNNTPTSYDPARSRKLLVHKKEAAELLGKGKEKGLTFVPIRVYSVKGKIKLEFGVARGRKQVDKRELLKKRAIQLDVARTLKESE
jgi:SsrA-binding protein